MALKHRAYPGDVEHEHLRTERTKHFRTPEGKHKVVASIRHLHWHDGTKFVETDHEPISNDGGITWTTRSTPYDLSWNAQTLTLSYTSKKGGSVQVKLVALDGVLPPQPGSARVAGLSIFCLVGHALELELRCRATGVEIFKILHDETAPRSLTWEVVEDRAGTVHANLMNTSGMDNMKRTAKRQGEFSTRRRIEIDHVRTPDDFISNPGKVIYRVTETFTGRTRLINPTTHARTWVNEVTYPVIIDVTITETPAADNDDGDQNGTNYWYTSESSVNIISSTTGRRPGYRFTTVAVPQGQTITSATLTLTVLSNLFGVGGISGPLFGNASDDAPAWANSAGPNNMTTTSASTTLDAGSTGTKVLDITAQVQEIVNRAGWASNNSMAFGVKGTLTGTDTGYIADSVDASPSDDPLLTIIYGSVDVLFAQSIF